MFPVQSWLLSQKRCVGCGMSIEKGEKREGKKGAITLCKCKRIYIYNKTEDTYRRALLTEV